MLLAELNSDITSLAFDTLIPGNTYYYQDVAYNQLGITPSTWQSITLPQEPNVDVWVKDPVSGPTTIDHDGDLIVYWDSNAVTESCTLMVGATDMGSVGTVNTEGWDTRLEMGGNIPIGTYTIQISCLDAFGQTAIDSIGVTVNPPPGGWYNVDTVNCVTFCSNIGKTNLASPVSGHKCSSGELIPDFSNEVVLSGPITFRWGCW